MKTYSTKLTDIKRESHTIDASEQVLGRLATQIAVLLMGKNKPTFARNMDVGDFVTVINAGKINVSGKKPEQKMYYRHSGYPGGLKSTSLDAMMESHPTRVVEYAVKGMLPTNRLRAQMMKRLRIYDGEIPTPVNKKPIVTSEKKEDNING
jgi:large subunit ribosomal protein L13